MKRALSLLLSLTMLCAAACGAEPPAVKAPESASRPFSQDPPASIGVATMLENGDIVLRLRTPLDGGATVGEGYFRYAPGTPEHEQVRTHVGGLVPGQSKPVPPWPEGH